MPVIPVNKSRANRLAVRPYPVITPRMVFNLSPPPMIANRMVFDFLPAGLVSDNLNTSSAHIVTHVPDSSNSSSLRLITCETDAPSTASTSSAIQAYTGMQISKPNGEPGRPKSGGYSLEWTLREVHGWTLEEVVKLMTFVRQEATRTLNIKVSYRQQDAKLIKAICDRAMEPCNWPILKSYEDCWPVIGSLKLALKYLSEQSRRTEALRRSERIERAAASSEGSLTE